MNTETVYKKIHKVFDQHQNDPHVEVEMRLGKFNGKLFDTNVGKDTFDKVYIMDAFQIGRASMIY